jgi:hypothetical protein
MSSDDVYGDSYDGRPARRGGRGSSGPKRATAGTATAIIMLAAILGFSGGAIAGSSGGDNDDPPTDPAASSPSPDDAGDDPDDGGTASPEPSDSELTLSSSKENGEAALGESGCGDKDGGACLIDIAGTLNPPEGGITLRLERSTDGGGSWSQECDNCTGPTGDDGTFTTRYWSGVEGENRFRLAGEDADGQRIESNEIVVTVVGDDKDD